MKREVGVPVIIAAIVIVLIVVGYFGYRTFGPAQSNVSAAQQINMMKHMKIGNK